MKTSKKDRVLLHIQSRVCGQAKTSDVIALCQVMFHNRCLRDAQELVTEGRLWRLKPEIKQAIYGNIKEEVFTAVKEDGVLTESSIGV